MYKQVCLLVVALLMCHKVSCQSNYIETEHKDALKLFEIDELIFKEQKFDKALSELDLIAKNVPKNYDKIYSEQKRFWDEEEYNEYVEVMNYSDMFILDAYSKVFYYYAVIYIERGDWKKAEQSLLTGLKQVPNEVHLMCEMGMLYQQKYQISFDKNHLDLSSKYFIDAIDKNSFRQSKMVARALRGVGFNLIELGDLDLAEELFIESLQYEEHKLAYNELNYIKQLRENTNPRPSISTGNTNSSSPEIDITSYTFLSEQMEKMPSELREIVSENRYAYIFSKATFFLSNGAEQNRKDDYFNYPLISWSEEKLISGCNQIVYHTKGLSPEYCFENLTESEFINLMEMLHFKVKKIRKTSYKDTVKGVFVHKVDKSKIELYCRISIN